MPPPSAAVLILSLTKPWPFQDDPSSSYSIGSPYTGLITIEWNSRFPEERSEVLSLLIIFSYHRYNVLTLFHRFLSFTYPSSLL
jgi:hypothetical protein